MHAVPKSYVDENCIKPAEVQVLKTQLSEMKAQLDSIMVAAGLQPFNSTGWTHTAHILGTSDLDASSYVNGLGTTGNNDQEWIIPCDDLTNYSIMALVMGSVVDYYRPTPGLGYSACDMLMSNTKHQWTNWEYLQSSFWWTPAYGGSYLGGSQPGWPQTQGWTRRYLSIWGGPLVAVALPPTLSPTPPGARALICIGNKIVFSIEK